MNRRITKSAPYAIDVDGHKFCLKPSKLIICRVSKPSHGIIEFSIDNLRNLEWYEADEFDENQFDAYLKETLSQLIEVYMLEKDEKLSSKACVLKHQLLDMFDEGENAI